MNNRIVTALALVLGVSSPAFASSGITEGFDGVFLWVFCGYCAIIIVAQLGAAIGSLASGRRGKSRKIANSQKA